MPSFSSRCGADSDELAIAVGDTLPLLSFRPNEEGEETDVTHDKPFHAMKTGKTSFWETYMLSQERTKEAKLTSSTEEKFMRRSLLTLITLGGILAAASCAAPGESQEPATISAAPTAAAVEPAENVEEIITRLEREWAAAIVNKDTATIDRLLAEDFNGTSATAVTYPKLLAINDLKNGVYVVGAMNLDEISVNSYDNAAVAFTSQEEKSTYNGKDISGHYHYTDFWIKKDGVWRVVASHGSRFSEPHGAPH
jgi:hypothetical protein